MPLHSINLLFDANAHNLELRISLGAMRTDEALLTCEHHELLHTPDHSIWPRGSCVPSDESGTHK